MTYPSVSSFVVKDPALNFDLNSMVDNYNTKDLLKSDSYAPFTSKTNKDLFNSGLAAGQSDTSFLDGFGDLLEDKHMMGNLTGLAGTVMQAISLPTMLENAKLQNKSLKFNLDTAKEEQARRNKNIKSFNSHRSAFV